ncbi:CIC11C00000004742 [Sungouiella intermedia]|uniref:CIC11C00000004742 n=1 Tax=Sungouiella intermedia TaxID=45354 RepID=A0A1L0C5X0_9ASCO|nr:CIC11C00000004742 [[Candida] intermedia]
MVNPPKRRANDADTPSKKPRLEVQQTLYVHNLNDKISRSLLKHNLYLLFSTYGDVLDINMKLRGQAHVIMESKEAAARALKSLLDHPFFGKPLHIDFSKSKSKCIELAERLLAEE